MTPDDEPTPAGAADADEAETGDDGPVADPDTVPVDTTQLDEAQEAIDDAREAVKKAGQADVIDEDR